MTWYLEYSTSNGETRQLRIEEGQALKIGRGSNSDTRIEDEVMSRLHCSLSLADDVPVLEDLGSSSGTYLQRQRISGPVTLTAGQSFQAGNTRFKLLSDSPLDAPTRATGVKRHDKELKELAQTLQEKGRIDRFTLRKLINDSGRNLVFYAIDSESEKELAIKVLPTEEGSDEDEARFMRAMGILQEVRDPCLVKLFRAGRRSRYCWVAMEWLPAGSLEDRIRKVGVGGCLDWRDAWKVANAISQSLHVLERNGVVHRNIKPTSILIRGDGDTNYVLSDLVVAKAHESAGGAMVTRQVYLPNDLAYTAPERLTGSAVNESTLQCDIYSLGAVLTECLTGEPPFGHGDLRTLLPKLNQTRHLVKREQQLGMNERIADMVNAMTEPDPRKRIPSALKLWQEVERVGKFAGLTFNV